LGDINIEEIDWLREKFSFSKMSCWARCPRKGFYRYVMKMKEEPGEPLLWGRATHAGQEYDNLERIDGRNPRMKHVLDVAADNYIGGQKDEFVRQHTAHLETFWESGARDEIRPVPGTVESKFQLGVAVTHDPDEEPVKSPVLIEGYIDVVSARPVIETGGASPRKCVVDYKTVGRKPSQHQVDDNLQLALYMLGADCSDGQLVNFIKYVKQRPKTFVSDPTPLTARRKELLLTFVSDTVSGFRRCIESGDFPKCTPECHWCGPGCGYYSMCYPEGDGSLSDFVEVLGINPAGTLPQDDWRKEQDVKPEVLGDIRGRNRTDDDQGPVDGGGSETAGEEINGQAESNEGE
jgi:hypothetical protein